MLQNVNYYQGVIETLMQQPLKVIEAVGEVSIDMWAGFPKVVEVVFPKAAIIIDRFHVMKQVTKGLSKVYQKLGIKPKPEKYLLRKNSTNLTEQVGGDCLECRYSSPK